MLKKALALCLLAPLALAACSDPIAAQQDEFLVYPEVTLNSYYLQNTIAIQQPVAKRVGNGQLEVTMVIRNKTDSDVSLDYEYLFMDENGTVIEGPSSWQFVRVTRKGIAPITFTSISPVAKFHVQIRNAK